MPTDFDAAVVLDDIALQHDQVVDGPLEFCPVAELAVLRAVWVGLARLRVLVRCKDPNRISANRR